MNSASEVSPSAPDSLKTLIERREDLRMQLIVKKLNIENAITELSAEQESTCATMFSTHELAESITQELNEKSQLINNMMQPRMLTEIAFIFSQKQKLQRTISMVEGDFSRSRTRQRSAEIIRTSAEKRRHKHFQRDFCEPLRAKFRNFASSATGQSV